MRRARERVFVLLHAIYVEQSVNKREILRNSCHSTEIPDEIYKRNAIFTHIEDVSRVRRH